MVRFRHAPPIEKQWGVVTRAQLIAAGMTVAAIDKQVARGDLRRLYRGVYAFGAAPLRDEGLWLAAVLACGPGAVLSHLSAARLWAMRVPCADRNLHVSLAAGQRRPPGITVHRTRRITGADTTVHRGVPVTTIPRTVIDCADLVTYAELRTLADHGARLDEAALLRAQQRAPGRRGAPNVTRLVAAGLRTRSELERAMRGLCRDARLEQPRINHEVLGVERDFVWPRHRVIVETDGGAFHAPKPARERDYERTAALVAAGWIVLRLTHDQVVHEPGLVAARLAALLSAAASA